MAKNCEFMDVVIYVCIPQKEPSVFFSSGDIVFFSKPIPPGGVNRATRWDLLFYFLSGMYEFVNIFTDI